MKKKIITSLLIFAMVLQTTICFAAESSDTETSNTTAQNVTATLETALTETAKNAAEDGKTSNGEQAQEGSTEGNTETKPEVSNSELEEQIAAQQNKFVVSPYEDVSVDSINLEAITELKEKGIMVGYEDGTFRPAKLVTRAEFVKMLIENETDIGSISDDILTGFTDVDDVNHWAKKYIYLGVQKGYLLGMGDGIFMPDATITYEQALKILVCYLGKEVAAKAKVSVNTPLWPTAYVLTGEQLGLNKNTSLIIGEEVDRANIAQLTYNALNVYSAKNNVYMGSTSSGGSGGGGGGGGRIRDKDDETKRVSGLIVSTPGVCIDPNTEAVTDPYILIKSDSEDEGYVKLRVPKGSGEDPYSGYLGYRVNVTYAKNDAMLNEISSFKSDSINKSVTVKAADFRRSASTDKLISYLDSSDNKKEIKLPDNLSDLKVVYNGVPIDKKHPPYDYTDTTFEAPMFTLDDIMPVTGEVKFVNCDGGAYDLAIVTTYDTVIAAANVSSSTGTVYDKYGPSEYILDKDKLFAYLNSLEINNGRALKNDDISVSITAKNSSTEIKPSNISRNNVLTVYASKDLTKIKVIKCSDFAGGSSSTGLRVTQEFDSSDNSVYLKSTKYIVSNYLINRFANIEEVSELFPYDGTVIASLDSIGEIVDVEEKEPTYDYGFLAYAEYEARNADTGKPSLSMRIITASNYSKPTTQYQEYKAATKFKLNGVNYKAETYSDADAALKASAATLNAERSSDIFKNYPYAQPVKIEYSDTSSMQIKSMVTLDELTDAETGTKLFYPVETYTYYDNYLTSKANSSNKRKIESSTICFSVPDNVYDYAGYKVTKGTSGLVSYSTHNAEVYNEKNTSSISLTFQTKIALFCDESLTSYPSASTYPFIVQSITRQYINDELITTIKGFEPTSVTSATVKEYNVEPKYIGGGTLKTVDTNIEVDVGDVIIFGKTPDGKYIRNVYQLVDASDKDSMGLDERFSEYGTPYAANNPRAKTPRYWRRYGIITAIDADSTTPQLLLDIDGNEMIIDSSSFITTCKPIVFGENDDTGKMEVTAPGTLLKELNPEEDLLFVYSTRGSDTANETFRCAYLIKRDDRDSNYPDPDRSYETVTFNVDPVGSSVYIANRRDDNISYYADDNNNDGVIVLNNVESGSYYYYVTCGDGYDMKSGTFKVAYNTTPAPINVKLTQATGTLVFTFEDKAVSTAKITLTLTDENDQEYKYETNTKYIQTDLIPIGAYTYSAETEGCETKTGYVVVEKDEDKQVTVKFKKIVKEEWTADRIADNWGEVTYAIDLKESSSVIYFNFDGDLTGKEFDMSKARVGLAEMDWINGIVGFIGKDIRLSDSYTKVAKESELVPGTYFTTETDPTKTFNGTFLKVMLDLKDAKKLRAVFDVEKIYDSQDEYTPIFAMEPGFYEGSTPQFIVLQQGKRVLTINNFEEEPESYYMFNSSETLVHVVNRKINLPINCEKIIFSTLKRVPIKEVMIDEDTLSNGVDFSEIHN